MARRQPHENVVEVFAMLAQAFEAVDHRPVEKMKSLPLSLRSTGLMTAPGSIDSMASLAARDGDASSLVVARLVLGGRKVVENGIALGVRLPDFRDTGTSGTGLFLLV
jgi:hypothetical protein